MNFVAFIGAFTALFAATIAVAQWDIKRVLAYSTISQLGFMVAAIGIGAYTAALFHLITHAFFKGLLFLGSGSVIHGVEHGFHHAHAACARHDEITATTATGTRRMGITARHHSPTADGDLEPGRPAGYAQHGRPAQAHA